MGKSLNAVRIAKSRMLGRVRELLAEFGEPVGWALRSEAQREQDHGWQ